MHRFRNEYPYYKIPVRRVNGNNGFVASVQPNRHTTKTQMETSRIAQATQPVAPAVDDTSDGQPSTPDTDWQTVATRLQADMDNFRKRQTRRAEEAIAAERERLLNLILPVADNLLRALNHENQADDSLRQGVELTYRELMRVLEAEGVARLETVGHLFDPNVHEAIATMPGEEIEPDTIIEEIEAGYMLGDTLLRPAKVVVAA